MPDEYRGSGPASVDALREAAADSTEQRPEGEVDSELLPALKKFILATTGSSLPAPASPNWRQVTGFIVVTVDLVLLYLLIPADLYKNRLFVFATKLVPWLLGAGFFALSSTIRDWVLQRCGKRWFLEVVAVFFVPLTLTQLPIFSVRARVIPPTAVVSAVEAAGDERSEVKLERKGDSVQVLFPGLKPNKVKVSEADSDLEFVANFSRLEILRGTMAQLPFLGRLFARPVRLTPLYLLHLHASRGTPVVHIEGDFPQAFLRSLGEQNSTNLSKCDTHSTKTQLFALDCPFNLNEHWMMPLPPGAYVVTQEQEGCSKSSKEIHLGHGEVEEISLDRLTCRK